MYSRIRKNIYTTRSGYTLVETVLYIAFFAVIIVVMVQGMITAMSTYQTSRAYRQVAIDGNLAMERIVREIRQSTSINDGASSYGVNPGTLTLNNTDQNGNPVVIKFWVDTTTSEIKVTENNVDEGGITSGVTSINTLTFTKLTTPVSVAIKIDMTVRSTYGVDVTANFHDTVVTRSTY